MNKSLLYSILFTEGWRKVIPTVCRYEGDSFDRYYVTGYSLVRSSVDGKYWECPNSYLSDTSIENFSFSVQQLFSASYYSDNSTWYEISCLTVSLAPSYDPSRTIYIKRKDTNTLFSLKQTSRLMYPHIFEIVHKSWSGYKNKPSSVNNAFFFKPEDRNKEIEIYIGLTPPK